MQPFSSATSSKCERDKWPLGATLVVRQSTNSGSITLLFKYLLKETTEACWADSLYRGVCETD